MGGESVISRVRAAFRQYSPLTAWDLAEALGWKSYRAGHTILYARNRLRLPLRVVGMAPRDSRSGPRRRLYELGSGR